MTEAKPLQKELETYEKHKDELIEKAEGKFVLVHGDQVAGTWGTYDDALKAGYEKFGLSPFLVKQVQRIERVQFVTRTIAPCPS
ncbi:MAG TPA: hypothetical protein VGN42_03370 [Pirellulales bacterium]|jgi:hypothetical protein|nr:hypothetical protein [Pirellulales bacterium]